MGQYISKDALVAEIEKIIPSEPYPKTTETLYGAEIYGKREVCFRILDLINSLEVKEVDLEEEIERVRKTHFINDDFEKATLEGRQITNIAKHFFELGVNTSNPLTWKDIANINDIVSEIIKECDNNILYDTKEDFCKEVLKRFKAQKGE